MLENLLDQPPETTECGAQRKPMRTIFLLLIIVLILGLLGAGILLAIILIEASLTLLAVLLNLPVLITLLVGNLVVGAIVFLSVLNGPKEVSFDSCNKY